MALTGAAAAQQPLPAQQCTCWDVNGVRYPEGTPGSTFCYQYDKDNNLVLSETLTLQQCTAMNNAWLQQQEQLRIQQAAEEAAKQQAAEEAAKQQAAEEAAKQQAAEEAAKQQAAEEAAKQQAAEEAAKQQAAEEAAKQQAAEEATKQQAAEEAAKQQAAEEAAKQQAAEEAAKQQAAEEAAKQQAAEEAAKQQAAEEAAKQQAAEEAAKQQAAEEAAIQQAAEEAERKAKEEEAAKQQAQEEAERKAKEEEAARLKAAQEEAERKAQEEAAAQQLPDQQKSDGQEDNAGLDQINVEPIQSEPVMLKPFSDSNPPDFQQSQLLGDPVMLTSENGDDLIPDNSIDEEPENTNDAVMTTQGVDQNQNRSIAESKNIENDGQGSNNDIEGTGNDGNDEQGNNNDIEGTGNDGNVEQGTGNDPEGTGNDGNVEQGTGNDPEGTGNDGNNEQGNNNDIEGTGNDGNDEQGTGNDPEGIGNDGNVEQGNNNDIEGTGNDGNVEQGTGNAPEDTGNEGNVEQGNNNDIEGTGNDGNVEQGTGNAPEDTGNDENVEQGNNNDIEGTGNDGQGNNNDHEGADTTGRTSGKDEIPSPDIIPVIVPVSKEEEKPVVENPAETDIKPVVETPAATDTAPVAEITGTEGGLDPETAMFTLMMAPAVSLEGDLKQIMLSTPNGGVVTTSSVPFVWLYDYDETSGTTDVTFVLEMEIKSGADTASWSTTVSSAACANRICSYTANMSSYKEASISWTVSGSYDDGGGSVYIPAPTPQSFTLKVAAPTATPTPTHTPTPTPTATPLPKPESPVQECPVGRYIVRTLGFYWAPSKNAEKYVVEWRNDKGQKGTMELSNSDVTCQNNRCIAHTTLPGIGNYVWTVTAVNKSGSARSNEMKFEIASNITTPQAYRPNGSIVNRSYPSFEWEDVRDGAIEYRIQVVGKYDNRIRMDRWFKVSDIYVGQGLCYVQTDLFLPAGSYSWRVQARNKDFPSGWSEWRDFYVECDYCTFNSTYYNTYVNTVPSCSFPAGTITVNKPDFQWRTLTGAAYYIVKLQDSAGKTLFENQVSNTNCTIELCTWTPNYTLPKNGNYTWSVAGYGGNNALWNIAYGSFTYQGTVVMKPISFLRPLQNGYLSEEAPVIIWTDPGEGTALFHVEIFSNANALLFSADLNREQAWCDNNTCSIEFKTIPDAKDYRIAVTPYSELNTKGDTVSLTFSKGGKPLKLSSPKEGAVVSSRPLFRWPLEYPESTQFELVLTDALNHVTTISPLFCGAVGVTCEDGEVFYSPDTPLPAGSYTVKLTAPGINALSEEVHITVK